MKRARKSTLEEGTVKIKTRALILHDVFRKSQIAYNKLTTKGFVTDDRLQI
jgi:hypothetical protein